MIYPTCAPAPEPAPEAAPGPVFDQAAEEAAIREAMDQMYAGANAHDVAAYTALMDENFESWDGSAKGRAVWGNGISDSWEREKDIQYKPLDEIGIQFMTPDVAVFKLHDEVTGSLDEDGKPVAPFKRLVARVFVKKNGKWLYAALFMRPIKE